MPESPVKTGDPLNLNRIMPAEGWMQTIFSPVMDPEHEQSTDGR
jgi:hypothetical protein